MKSGGAAGGFSKEDAAIRGKLRAMIDPTVKVPSAHPHIAWRMTSTYAFDTPQQFRLVKKRAVRCAGDIVYPRFLASIVHDFASCVGAKLRRCSKNSFTCFAPTREICEVLKPCLIEKPSFFVGDPL